MSRTKRIWDKNEFIFRMKLDIGCTCPLCLNDEQRYIVPLWKKTSNNVFGRHKKRSLRKEMRHTTRSQNRTRFAHNIFEPFKHAKIDYFD